MTTNNALNAPEPFSPSIGGTGVNNSSTITLGGNISTAGSLTTSGAFGLTLTTTGATNVTLPTSGTLATTSQIPSLPLSLANGGTAASLAANTGGIFYSTASAGAILAGTATANQILLSGSTAAPAWSTATYPSTTTINQLLYSSSANTITGLATANNGVVITSSGGVPSISSTLPSLVQGNITSVGALTSGSLTTGFTTVAVPQGGTGNASTTPYAVQCGGTTATGALQAVSGLGNAGQVLTSNGASALPTWQPAATVGVTSVATSGLATGGTITSTGTITVTAASQADQETGTSTTVAVVPNVQQYHKSAAKFWVRSVGGSTTITASYNVSSVANTGTGRATFTLTNAFSGTNVQAICATAYDTSVANVVRAVYVNSIGTSTFEIDCVNGSATPVDPTGWNVIGFGDQ